MKKGELTKRQYGVDERSELVAAYRGSGKTQREWCQLEEVSIGTLGRWILEDKNRQKDSLIKQGWAQVSVAPLVDYEPILLKAGKFSITIGGNINMKVLAELLAVLVPLC
jgi:hypothetical protein